MWVLPAWLPTGAGRVADGLDAVHPGLRPGVLREDQGDWREAAAAGVIPQRRPQRDVTAVVVLGLSAEEASVPVDLRRDDRFGLGVVVDLHEQHRHLILGPHPRADCHWPGS
ncbi:hypothetical protein [Streptomyces sp. CB01580]|uniref:hypothetical protein n=1 Tax=Streptomyces sp. CB01580 TaxID=1703933 RepID=UPI001300D938|nr:hypothetical protein [Streptomyces sp. CB01580]